MSSFKMTVYAQEDRDGDWLLALLLLAAQLIIGLVALFLVWFQGMSSARCDNQCDYQLFHWVAVAFTAFAAIAFLCTVVVVLVGCRRPMTSFAPAVGLAATVVAALIAHRLGSIALGL